MPNKLPYMQFYVNDWMSDTAFMTLSARGFWFDLLCIMHQQNRASVTCTISQLARACRCSEKEAIDALNEIIALNIANVTCNGNVTEMLRKCYENVTVTCRRLQNIQNEHIRVKEAMKKKRSKKTCYGNVTKMLQECNENVTEVFTDTESEKKKEIYKYISKKESLPSDSNPANTKNPLLLQNKPENIQQIINEAATRMVKITEQQAQDFYDRYEAMSSGGTWMIRNTPVTNWRKLISSAWVEGWKNSNAKGGKNGSTDCSRDNFTGNYSGCNSWEEF